MIQSRAISVMTLLILSLFCVDISAAVSGSLLKVRASRHPEYFRIVFEGADELIKKGRVTHQGQELIVRFPDTQITLNTRNLPLSYKLQNDTVVVSLLTSGKLKVFSLDDPGRLVVDVFPVKKEGAEDVEQRTHTKKQKQSNTQEARVASGKKKIVNEQKIRYQEKIERKKALAAARKNDINNYADIVVPEKLETLWQMFESGNAIGNLKKLQAIKTEGTEELAFLHFLYGMGYSAAEKNISAVEHLRLAYIYASQNSLKDLALFRRAEVYEEMKLYHEARSNYLIFIDEFPSSKRIRKAHLGLGHSLQQLGLYSEAVTHYDKAGNSAEALFSKANALQKLERTEEAAVVYEKAMRVDRKYPVSSFETYYLIGENMRLSGELKKAKSHFSHIQYGPFFESAKISLGLIAMDEADVKEAGRNFMIAAQSKNRAVKVRALFSLSFALLSIDKTKEAIGALEEIRFNHINSDLYKDALVALARLYRKEGRIRDAVSLLKELAYGKKPPIETFSELQDIVMEASEKTTGGDTEEMQFMELWRELGKWLIDESREEFLIRMAQRLRYEGKPFIELCTWLVKKGSQEARVKAAVALSDYYAGIRNIDLAEEYMTRAIGVSKPGDDALRVKAKIFRLKGEYRSAVDKLKEIRDIQSKDLKAAGNLILDMENAKSGDVQYAIDFYESQLERAEWKAEDYVRLADILYKNGNSSEALRYYRIAYKKNPDDEWIIYRIGRDSGRSISRDMLSELGKGGTLLGRLAKSKLMEKELLSRVKEVY